MFDVKDGASFHRLFVRTPEIMGYLVLAIALAIAAAWVAPSAGAVLWPAITMVIFYPAAEYLLHRFLLHANFLARWQSTSPLWYRIHYRHHSKPSDQSVILAAPYTILGAVGLIAALLGLAFGTWPAFLACLAVGNVLIVAYEYAHSVCHATFPTSNPYLRSIRTSHVLHHFHAEGGNYGITNNLSDRLFQTRYDEKSLPPRSPTVRNLGYDAEMKRAFPWIAQIEADANERREGETIATTGAKKNRAA